jgi:hypothetical protein
VPVEIPVWLQNVLLTLLLSGLLAPGMLLLPEAWQGTGAIVGVLAFSFAAVVVVRRRLR